jgi:hypothetical protein
MPEPVQSSVSRIPARTRRQAMDWSLVLTSQGIEHTIEHQEETGWITSVSIVWKTGTGVGAGQSSGLAYSSTGGARPGYFWSSFFIGGVNCGQICETSAHGMGLR